MINSNEASPFALQWEKERRRSAAVSSDPVNSPPHYTAGKVEVIDFIEQVATTYIPSIAYHIGNCLKYLARAPLKGKLLEDLKKARWYLDRAIQVLERKEAP